MRNKILLSALIVCMALFSMGTDANAKTVINNRTKKVIVVKKGPNRGRTVIIKKQGRRGTKVITRNRHGRTVRFVPHTRGGRTCGTQVIRRNGRR